MVAGLHLVVGLGWAMFIFDLFGGGTPSDYHSAQKTNGPAKSLKHKLLGIVVFLIGVVLLIQFVNTL